jgi:hypothetical protein
MNAHLSRAWEEARFDSRRLNEFVQLSFHSFASSRPLSRSETLHDQRTEMATARVQV